MDPLADLPLPPLREDLRLTAIAAGQSGEPAWVIQDTVVNRFYRIGWLEFECLTRWGQSPAEISAQIAEQTALKPDVEQILDFRHFLEQHQLLRPGAQAVERLKARSQGSSWLTWNWWLHHYLFFRVPLLRPQRLLERLARHLGWLFTPLTGFVVLGLSVLGILLAAHQWDTFKSAVVESFSAEGLLGFALALVVGKTLHELGHALVATRLGLRVAHMGVAFVVLWPMLYTDTGEAWKLRSSRQRLAIASAGILTELSLAGLATLGWALCEPGPLRSALLYLATTNWVLSLALNLSPFMRFDGYYVLSDLLDFPNLHERSGALARVSLRRTLLGLEESWPESFAPARRRLLIAFAMTTWIYRLALFLGIAIAVYLLFFKALGIFLFIVEISWFIALPVWRELQHWWANRAAVPVPRRLIFAAVACGLLVLLAVPWQTEIHAFGVIRAEQQLRVFAPYPSRLREIHTAGAVQAGDALVVLEEPDIASRMERSAAGVRSYDARLAGLLADTQGLDDQAVTRQRMSVQIEEVESAKSEIARLTMLAPFAGQWRDLNPEWQSGQWMGTTEAVGVLFDPERWQVDAYVRQDEVHRLAVGSPVRFYPEGETTPLKGAVIAIGSTRVSQLEHPILAARFGGPLATAREGTLLVPTPALFHVLVQMDAPPATLREARGHLQIEGARRSLLGEGMRQLAAVVLRESGF